MDNDFGPREKIFIICVWYCFKNVVVSIDEWNNCDIGNVIGDNWYCCG